MTNCGLCHQRPPRRNCPALNAAICARCCGEERERTIDCPFDCEHLIEAHHREPLFPLPADYPNQDLPVTELFLASHEPLMLTVMSGLFFAAESVAAVDLDLREALAAMIDFRRSGVLPELGQPADAIVTAFEARFLKFTEKASAEGLAFTGEDVLRMLAHFQREEMQGNNQRSRSRAYIDFLRAWMSAVAADFFAQPPTEAGN